MRRRFCALALLLAASPAWAAARSVALVGVSGPGGAHFAEKLAEDLAEICEVVPGEIYRAQAEHLGRTGAAPEDVQAVAAAVHVDAVIGGAVVGSGRARQLLVAVRDGLTGRLVARGRYLLGSASLAVVRDRVVRDLVRALEQTGPRPDSKSAPPMAEGESTPEIVEPPPSEPTPELSVTAERAPQEEVASQGVFAGIGYSVLGRRLSFDVASAPGITGGAASAIRADAAVFPLALSSELASAHPVAASFGLVGSYEHVFTLSSTTDTGTSHGHASHWLVLLVGRIPLGHAARGGTLTIETGYQQFDWVHESAQDVGVPDVTYELIDAGLGWDRAIGTPRLVGALRVAYLGLVDAGGITADKEYGRASGNGAEAEGSLTAWPTRWLWLRAGVRYSYIGLSFAQNGTRFARSAADQWVGGTVEVGFAL
jgi:hypothetical protein